MAKVGRPSNAASRRQEVLSAAVDVFSQRGYRGTSMNEIAVASGLSKPTLYHYFDSKEEILVRLYEDLMERSVAEAIAISDEVDDPIEAFRALIVQRVVATCTNQAMHKVFFEEEEELPRHMMDRLLKHRHDYEGILKDVLHRLTTRYRSSATLDVTMYVNTCLGAANWVYKWYDPHGSLTPEQIGNQIAAYLLASLNTDPHTVSL
ncbi:TetR family transcriptional regulator [Antricoccus suffuscus]|uniref:TetR family transcriptional regulator n=1 Tax=Antricoccus suffuscus TaxID=1629062 RepID=A0A2T1A6T4_9ACTN|nr:TetR/AcrR family transcriptional regulator [Antricoccus suffuscus]PRZ44264.1 TetR family transcriptional regulator [Antricoccus suffuscus]